MFCLPFLLLLLLLLLCPAPAKKEKEEEEGEVDAVGLPLLPGLSTDVTISGPMPRRNSREPGLTTVLLLPLPAPAPDLLAAAVEARVEDANEAGDANAEEEPEDAAVEWAALWPLPPFPALV